MPQSRHILQTVARTIRDHHLLGTGDKVIVGVSAGPDSTALLHLLYSLQLDLSITAAYIDHGLRPGEVEAEKQHVANLAQLLGYDFISKCIDVKGYAGSFKMSIEESARYLRYKALEEIRSQKGATIIAVGHTADDQVEEFFIRLMRGSGMKGLAGMQYSNGKVIRPLLDITKNELLAYIEKLGLVSCHDSSNDSRDFLRNQIRLDLLPILEQQFNPNIRQTVRQTMSILRQEEDYLDVAATETFSDLCTPATAENKEIELNRSQFLTYHSAIQRRVLEKICWKLESRPTFRIIDQLQELISKGSNDAQAHLPLGFRVRVGLEKITFSFPMGRKAGKESKIPPITFSYSINNPQTTHISELDRYLKIEEIEAFDKSSSDNRILYLDKEKITFPLTLRPIAKGEKMKPLGAPGSKKINRVLSDRKIPASQKTFYPVLADRNGVIAVLGVRIDERVKITASTREILAVSLTP